MIKSFMEATGGALGAATVMIPALVIVDWLSGGTFWPAVTSLTPAGMFIAAYLGAKLGALMRR